jgi:hypothetical protein
VVVVEIVGASNAKCKYKGERGREQQKLLGRPTLSLSARGFAHLNFEPIDGDVLGTFGANGIAPHFLQI